MRSGTGRWGSYYVDVVEDDSMLMRKVEKKSSKAMLTFNRHTGRKAESERIFPDDTPKTMFELRSSPKGFVKRGGQTRVKTANRTHLRLSASALAPPGPGKTPYPPP